MTKLEKELDAVLQIYFPDDYYEELRLQAVKKLAIWHKSKVKNLNIPCVNVSVAEAIGRRCPYCGEPCSECSHKDDATES